MKRFDPATGHSIQYAALVLVKKANELGENVVGNFNDIDMIARPGDDPKAIEASYHFQHNLKADEKQIDQ